MIACKEIHYDCQYKSFMTKNRLFDVFLRKDPYASAWMERETIKLGKTTLLITLE